MDWIVLVGASIALFGVGWGLGCRYTRSRMLHFDEWTGRFGR